MSGKAPPRQDARPGEIQDPSLHIRTESPAERRHEGPSSRSQGGKSARKSPNAVNSQSNSGNSVAGPSSGSKGGKSAGKSPSENSKASSGKSHWDSYESPSSRSAGSSAQQPAGLGSRRRSSARTSPKSSDQSSRGYPQETVSDGEDGQGSKSSGRHHRRKHHKTRSDGHTNEKSREGNSSTESSTSAEPSSQAPDDLASPDSQQQQTAGYRKQDEKRSRNHKKHRRKHKDHGKYDSGGALAQQRSASPEDGFHPGTGQGKRRKTDYDNFDEMIKIHRRQSLLAETPQRAKFFIGLPRTEDKKRRRHRGQRSHNSSHAATSDSHSLDSDNGYVFAHPITNELFEALPSTSSVTASRRVSVIAALVQNKNWRDGSRIFRPSEFRGLDKTTKRASTITGDPFLDPSCSLFINNDLFENELPDPARKYGPVFVGLPIPYSDVSSTPREALAQAGWVKSHPDDPIEVSGGFSPTSSNDQALGGSSPPTKADRARMNHDSATVSNSGVTEFDPYRPPAKKLGLSQLPMNNGANQTVSGGIWSQGFGFYVPTAGQAKNSLSSPPQNDQLLTGFQADQQFGVQAGHHFGGGTSGITDFGEQYAGSMQDSGFNSPQSGAQSLAETQIGTLMSLNQGFTFESYAKMNFSKQPVGIWPLSLWKRMPVDVLLTYTKASQHPCAPVSSWQDPIGEPLLRTVPPRLRKKALAVFAHVMAYMGDVPTKQTSNFHIHQILSAGIRYMALRDEIFSQIIKQTTFNPSRLSNMKGWQAMAICCGTFLPSETFMPYLDAHLEQVAGGNIARKGTADNLGQFSEGMVNPSEAAAYSLVRLRKLKKIGPRRLLPLAKEIEAVELMDSIASEVLLPNGSWQAFLLHPMDTSEEVVEHLVKILGLLEARSYGLFQLLDSSGGTKVEKLIASKAYILEVEASCNTLGSTPKSLQDIRYGPKTRSKLARLFCGCGQVEVLNSSLIPRTLGGGETQFSEQNLHMLLKRKIYLVDLATLPKASNTTVLAFEYSQAVRDVVNGLHIVSEGDAMMLGAIQLRADLETSQVPPEILAGLDGSKYGPTYFVQGNEGAWKDAIATTLAALPYSGSSMSWKQDYIDYVKSRCPLYEACHFFLKPLANPSMPEEMYVAVSSTGVYFVNANTRDTFNFLEYAEIASWGYTPTAFSIVAGSMTISTDYLFQTTQGLEIGNVLQIYVDLIQGIHVRSAEAQPGNQEQPWNGDFLELVATGGFNQDFQPGAPMQQPPQQDNMNPTDGNQGWNSSVSNKSDQDTPPFPASPGEVNLPAEIKEGGHLSIPEQSKSRKHRNHQRSKGSEEQQPLPPVQSGESEQFTAGFFENSEQSQLPKPPKSHKHRRHHRSKGRKEEQQVSAVSRGEGEQFTAGLFENSEQAQQQPPEPRKHRKHHKSHHRSKGSEEEQQLPPVSSGEGEQFTVGLFESNEEAQEPPKPTKSHTHRKHRRHHRFKVKEKTEAKPHHHENSSSRKGKHHKKSSRERSNENENQRPQSSSSMTSQELEEQMWHQSGQETPDSVNEGTFGGELW